MRQAVKLLVSAGAFAAILLSASPYAVQAKNVQDDLNSLVQEGIISPATANYPHSHNEFLFTAVVFGTCGVLALLALYLVPVVYFLCYGARQAEAGRATAVMGLVLCLAFVSDGLVDVMFIWRECSLFYTVLLSLLMAALLRWRQPAPEYLGTS